MLSAIPSKTGGDDENDDDDDDMSSSKMKYSPVVILRSSVPIDHWTLISDNSRDCDLPRDLIT